MNQPNQQANIEMGDLRMLPFEKVLDEIDRIQKGLPALLILANPKTNEVAFVQYQLKFEDPIMDKIMSSLTTTVLSAKGIDINKIVGNFIGEIKFMEDKLNSESFREMSVNDPGHDYELHNFENGVQNIKFIKKEKQQDSGGPNGEQLTTVHDGTTNEAVLQVLIHRMEVLNKKMPSSYNEKVLVHLTEALKTLYERTEDRKNRGVEGTHLE